MTLVSLPSPIAWPGICGATTGTPFVQGAATLTSVGHYLAYVFVAREDMTVSHVGVRAGSSVGSPTLEFRIETLDASGLPSGTLWATNTNGTSGTVSSSTQVLQALTASASITKGQAFCVKIALASGTSQVLQNVGNMSMPQVTNLPYQVLNTGTPTKGLIGSSVGAVALGSSSTTFYQLLGSIPVSAVTNSTFNNTSSARRGLRFTPPMNCRAVGLRWYNTTAVGDFNAILFNDAGAELSSSSTAFDGDLTVASANCVNFIYFDNPVTLTAGTTYRIAIEPTSATNVNVSTITLPSANYRGASPAGTTAHYTTYVASSWTDSATDQIPLMDVLLDQVDDGTGSGGGGVIGVIGG